MPVQGITCCRLTSSIAAVKLSTNPCDTHKGIMTYLPEDSLLHFEDEQRVRGLQTVVCNGERYAVFEFDVEQNSEVL